MQYVSGTIHFGKLMEIIQTVRADPAFKAHFHSLIDLRDADVNLDMEKMKSYVRKVHHGMSFQVFRKHAVLISRPEHFVLATYVQELLRGQPLKICIFSTFKSAAYWLNLRNMSEEAFYEYIQALYPGT